MRPTIQTIRVLKDNVLKIIQSTLLEESYSMNTPVMPPRRPVLLVIMDGMAVNPSPLNNAVAAAKTPHLDAIQSNHPTCLIEASGMAVGLPDGQMGNSEVGHLSLGAGTVLKQDLVKISDSIESGEINQNSVLLDAVSRAKTNNKPLHLLGLVSDGGVHSHIDHAVALIKLCQAHGVKPLLHMITDGRDTAPACADAYLPVITEALSAAGGDVASVIGRYFALDRDKRWERVGAAWQAIVKGEGRQASDVHAAINDARLADENDEFITPTVLPAHQPLSADDTVVFFNFRNDRPRELSEALALDKFEAFDRGDYQPVALTTMTRYESSYPFPYAFDKDAADVTLGDVIAESSIAQLRCAETEKYPHVTFFFNGGRDDPLKNEDRLLVNSPKVATYDLQPEMSAHAIADGVVDALTKRHYGLVVVNFANADMVGHTGVAEAVIKSVETVDEVVGRLWEAATSNDYSIVLTADHGNADLLVDPVTGDPHTQHTTFPVPCTVYDSEPRELGCGNSLTGIAPTVLQLMGLSQPAQMKGRSLLLN